MNRRENYCSEQNEEYLAEELVKFISENFEINSEFNYDVILNSIYSVLKVTLINKNFITHLNMDKSEGEENSCLTLSNGNIFVDLSYEVEELKCNITIFDYDYSKENYTNHKLELYYYCSNDKHYILCRECDTSKSLITKYKFYHEYDLKSGIFTNHVIEITNSVNQFNLNLLTDNIKLIQDVINFKIDKKLETDLLDNGRSM